MGAVARFPQILSEGQLQANSGLLLTCRNLGIVLPGILIFFKGRGKSEF